MGAPGRAGSAGVAPDARPFGRGTSTTVRDSLRPVMPSVTLSTTVALKYPSRERMNVCGPGERSMSIGVWPTTLPPHSTVASGGSLLSVRWNVCSESARFAASSPVTAAPSESFDELDEPFVRTTTNAAAAASPTAKLTATNGTSGDFRLTADLTPESGPAGSENGGTSLVRDTMYACTRFAIASRAPAKSRCMCWATSSRRMTYPSRKSQSESALLMASAVPKRPFGERASAFITIASRSGGMPTAYVDGGSMGSLATARSAATVSPLKSFSPVSSSQSTTPVEKMSERRSTSPSLACSGAMYDTLPLSTPLCVSLTLSDPLAMPKSSTFTCPS
jgi:hypothetical protein